MNNSAPNDNENSKFLTVHAPTPSQTMKQRYHLLLHDRLRSQNWTSIKHLGGEKFGTPSSQNHTDIFVGRF